MELPRLLLVAGRDEMARELTDQLREQGYPLAEQAEDWDDALKRVEQEAVDVIMVAARLPGGVNGVNAAARIKRLTEIPVILVAEYVKKECLEQTKRAQLHGYIMRPFTGSKICAMVELAIYNAHMEQENRAAQHVLQENRQRLEETLRRSSKQLQEVNTALKVILEHRDEEKEKLGQQVVNNVKRLVLPALNRLEQTSLDNSQRYWLDVAKAGLGELTSPFITHLSASSLGLTARELEVANLIRQGSTSKNIADMLGITVNSVIFHRQNIRAKLGIKNRKINLTRYLRHMAAD
jgi:DNA-binding NarL/FixJ family response regulator